MKKLLAMLIATAMLFAAAAVPAGAEGAKYRSGRETVSAAEKTGSSEAVSLTDDVKLPLPQQNSGFTFAPIAENAGNVPLNSNGISSDTAAVLHAYVPSEGGYGYWGRFSADNPGSVENQGETDMILAAAFAGGKVYGYLYQDNYEGLDTRFFVMNPETLERVYPGGTSSGKQAIAMAFNHANNVMYALIAEGGGSWVGLYTVDLATGIPEFVGAVNAGSAAIMTLAIDGEGNAYGLSASKWNAGAQSYDNSILYSIDLASGNCTEIGQVGARLTFLQAAVWNHTDDKIYWIQNHSEVIGEGEDAAVYREHNLYTVDPDTLDTVCLGAAASQMTSLWMENDEPAEIPEYRISFVDWYNNQEFASIMVSGGTAIDEITYPEPPEHEGFEFVGWAYDDDDGLVYNDMTIKAKYHDLDAVTAAIILTANDVWGDGTGYQMLFDADATAIGNEIPAPGYGNWVTGDLEQFYNAFEYMIPADANIVPYDQHVLIGETESITVEPGIYDWCVTNPSPNGGIYYIASDGGNVGGKQDDYAFEAGFTYEFTVYMGADGHDATDVEIKLTDGDYSGSPEPPPAPPVPENVLLNGYISYNRNETSQYWGQFSVQDPSDITNVFDMEKVAAGAFAGGKIYGFMENMFTPAGYRQFFCMDAETHEVNYCGKGTDRTVAAMAYNHNNDTMYALAITNDGYMGLYTIDLALGTLSYVAHVDANGQYIFTLAFDGEGNAYGINAAVHYNSTLWNINIETGLCTPICDVGHELNYIQSMTWDYDTNRLYWAQFYRFIGPEDECSALCVIDPVEGTVIDCGTIGNTAEVTSLYIPNDIEIPPVEMPDFNITFIDEYTGMEIPGGYTVQAGSVLDAEDFPEAPEHPGIEFVGWNYDGNPIYEDTAIGAMYYDPNMIGYYFESDPWEEGWTKVDSDGDGHNWNWYCADNQPEDLPYPEGQGMVSSQSFINDGGAGIVLTPDNWLISPVVPGGGSVKFLYAAMDASYCTEHIGVYVTTDGGESWSEELGYFTSTGEVQMGRVYLSQYAGQNIQIAFRHYNSTDQFIINLDAVEVFPGGAAPVPPAPLPGDYDCNGIVDVQDAILTLRAAMGLITPSEQSLLNADIDGSGILTVTDAITVLRMAMGLI